MVFNSLACHLVHAYPQRCVSGKLGHARTNRGAIFRRHDIPAYAFLNAVTDFARRAGADLTGRSQVAIVEPLGDLIVPQPRSGLFRSLNQASKLEVPLFASALHRCTM